MVTTRIISIAYDCSQSQVWLATYSTEQPTISLMLNLKYKVTRNCVIQIAIKEEAIN